MSHLSIKIRLCEAFDLDEKVDFRSNNNHHISYKRTKLLLLQRGSLCFGGTKCGTVEIEDYIPSDEEKRETEENHPVKDIGQYLCLIKYAASHSLLRMSSLNEISGSEVMWDFLSCDVSLPKTFHLYLLRTSKTTTKHQRLSGYERLVPVQILHYRRTRVTHLSKRF